MTIKIIENEKPNMKKIKFDCDEPINKKLDKYPLLKEFNKPNTTIFIGGMGGGKTTLALNFITNSSFYKKCFHHIYVFMPENSRNSLKDNPLEELPEDQFYDELNVDNIEDVYNRVQENSKNKEYSFILYDDVQDAMKKNEVVLKLQKLIIRQRHLKLVNFILLQNYYALNNQIREVANHFIFFRLGKKQLEKIREEVVKLDKKVFYDIIDEVFEKEPDKRTWLFFSKNNKIFNEFDEIIVEE